MRSRVRLLARIPATSKTGNKYLCWQQVKTTPKGLPKFVNEYADARAYALRYTLPGGRRKTETLASKDWNEVCTLLSEKEVEFERMERGLDHAVAGQVEKTDRVTITEAIEEYMRAKESQGKADATLYAYRHSLELFRDRCGLLFMDELDKNLKPITEHILWMKEHMDRRTEGDKINNTIREHLKQLGAFYRFNGMTFPLAKKDWPFRVEKEVNCFTSEEIERMLSKATVDEKDLILFFLSTGFRDKEGACAYYSDIDWDAKTINVNPKPEWGFRIKNKKQRVVPVGLPDILVERLRARRERYPAAVLIFPNRHNRPDDDLIEKVRNASRRVGFNDEDVTLHRFRRTFGTRYAEKHGIKNAMYLLGHADIATTTRYLAKTTIPQTAVNDVFADVAAK